MQVWHCPEADGSEFVLADSCCSGYLSFSSLRAHVFLDRHAPTYCTIYYYKAKVAAKAAKLQNTMIALFANLADYGQTLLFYITSLHLQVGLWMK